MTAGSTPQQATFGKLYGVGVGPGASDLLTLRAVQVMNTVDVLAIPRRDENTPSVAWQIVEPVLGEVQGQQRLFLNMPMTKDPAPIRAAWEIAFEAIGECLAAGKSVAFIAEGDPLFFSTFIYLKEEAVKRWPTAEIEVVPAVSSFTAVPSVVQWPIADGKERVAVIPASYGLDQMELMLDLFDTLILMKVSRVMPQLTALLEKKGLLERSIYVSRATMADEKIVTDLKSLDGQRCDYFSMVMVSKKERNGILMKQAG